ncbi:DsbA family protein [Streptomyces sp. URMC 128]|uniref:DsbA family protein n=1 Tax=Streptomyces sp. URMC 128 TaxID=3423404 RepID=UPI003F1A0DED
MRIEIWADVVCAWAYIGKRRLERAIADRDDVEVVWRPFRIDPSAPSTALPMDEAMRDPLMDEALRACAPGLSPAENRVRISQIAATEGLGPWRGASWRASSHDAHRLLALAHEHAGPGVQDTLAEGLMHAYFIEGLDISDRAVLRAVALRSGFREGPDLLETDAGELLVRELLLQGKARKVRTSPSFVVGNQALAGAQSSEAIADFLAGIGPQPDVPAEVSRMRWAESLMEERDPLGAVTLLRPLLADFADDPGVRILAARAYFGSAQLNRARAMLEPLVEQRPDDSYVRLLYGRTLQRLGLEAQAQPHLRLAVAASD